MKCLSVWGGVREGDGEKKIYIYIIQFSIISSKIKYMDINCKQVQHKFHKFGKTK